MVYIYSCLLAYGKWNLLDFYQVRYLTNMMLLMYLVLLLSKALNFLALQWGSGDQSMLYSRVAVMVLYSHSLLLLLFFFLAAEENSHSLYPILFLAEFTHSLWMLQGLFWILLLLLLGLISGQGALYPLLSSNKGVEVLYLVGFSIVNSNNLNLLDVGLLLLLLECNKWGSNLSLLHLGKIINFTFVNMFLKLILFPLFVNNIIIISGVFNMPFNQDQVQVPVGFIYFMMKPELKDLILTGNFIYFIYFIYFMMKVINGSMVNPELKDLILTGNVINGSMVNIYLNLIYFLNNIYLNNIYLNLISFLNNIMSEFVNLLFKLLFLFLNIYLNLISFLNNNGSIVNIYKFMFVPQEWLSLANILAHNKSVNV